MRDMLQDMLRTLIFAAFAYVYYAGLIAAAPLRRRCAPQCQERSRYRQVFHHHNTSYWLPLISPCRYVDIVAICDAAFLCHTLRCAAIYYEDRATLIYAAISATLCYAIYTLIHYCRAIRDVIDRCRYALPLLSFRYALYGEAYAMLLLMSYATLLMLMSEEGQPGCRLFPPCRHTRLRFRATPGRYYAAAFDTRHAAIFATRCCLSLMAPPPLFSLFYVFAAMPRYMRYCGTHTALHITLPCCRAMRAAQRVIIDMAIAAAMLICLRLCCHALQDIGYQMPPLMLLPL